MKDQSEKDFEVPPQTRSGEDQHEKLFLTDLLVIYSYSENAH